MLNLSLLSCSPGAIQGSHYFWALPLDFYFICLISSAAIPPSKAAQGLYPCNPPSHLILQPSHITPRLPSSLLPHPSSLIPPTLALSTVNCQLSIINYQLN